MTPFMDALNQKTEPQHNPAKQLSIKSLKAFQRLYRDKYSVDLTDQEAREKALKLLSFLRHIDYPLLEGDT